MKRLLQQAGRAAACPRRLEQSSRRALRLAESKANGPLLRQDERHTALIESTDPFHRLNGVLARIDKTPAGVEQAAATYRRLAATPEKGRERRQADTPFPVESARVRSIQPSSPPWEAPRAAANAIPALAADRRFGKIAPLVAEKVAGPPLSAPPATVRVSQSFDGAQASAEWTARFNRADVLDAFRTALGSQPAANTTAIHSAADSAATPRRVAEDKIGDALARVVATGRTDERVSPAPVAYTREAPAQSASVEAPGSLVRQAPRNAFEAGGRAMQWPSLPERTQSARFHDAPSTVTGLRRLAALATDALPVETPAVNVPQATPAVSRIDEELERILRREAQRHGINLLGATR